MDHDRFLIEMHGVRFRYPGTSRLALDGVDLAVGPGEVFGLLGPNGAGKTTLLRLAAGLVAPTEGAVRLIGDAPASLRRREAARRAAFVPASLHVPLPMTVREFVALGRLPHLRGLFESRDDRAKVRAALDLVEAADLADRPYASLSSGEQKRTLVARALAQEPRVLLLDEPTATLDIAHGVALLDRLRALARREGLAVLASIHDLNLALQFCDRLALLRDGHVRAQGEPESVMRYPVVREVFGCDVYIGRNELNGSLFMVPLAPPREPGPGPSRPVGS